MNIEINETFKSKYSAKPPKEHKNKKSFKTNFKFLNSIASYQEGHIHLLLGRTNKGKSTLITSLATEAAINGHRPLIYIAEDRKEDLEFLINSILLERIKNKSKIEIIRNNILILKDADILDISSPEPLPWVNSLRNKLIEEKADILFFDNISSCPFGEATPQIQAEFIKYLRYNTELFKFPTFAGIHPSKTTSPTKKLSSEDIRANSAFANTPSYIFALHNFSHKPDLRVIELIKNRTDSAQIGSFHTLNYKKLKRGGFYLKDAELDQISAKNLFSLGNFKKSIS